MRNEKIEINNYQQLKQLVSHTLCRQNDFEEGIFQITERLLKKGNHICGIFFCLHGPRSVKLTAVWEMESNTILFYSATGERFQRIWISPPRKLPVRKCD